jgi:hypothetical protein
MSRRFSRVFLRIAACCLDLDPTLRLGVLPVFYLFVVFAILSETVELMLSGKMASGALHGCKAILKGFFLEKEYIIGQIGQTNGCAPNAILGTLKSTSKRLLPVPEKRQN